ncbi:ankyrin repeat domain-containing protein, partial [Salmonella enterica]|nr:ankyrin repeat domain-containing protein [Salmonella enterica]
MLLKLITLLSIILIPIIVGCSAFDDVF